MASRYILYVKIIFNNDPNSHLEATNRVVIIQQLRGTGLYCLSKIDDTCNEVLITIKKSTDILMIIPTGSL